MPFTGGAPGDNSLDGTGGSDVLSGHGGNDTLRGGDGNDTLFAGNGDDRLQGGDDNDALIGGRGHDHLFGGDGDDFLDGGGGNDVLYGAGGGDGVFGLAGDDVVYGGNGDDFVSGESGTDYVYGGRGYDLFGVYMLERGDLSFHPDAEYIMDFHHGQDALLVSFYDDASGQLVSVGLDGFDGNGDGRLTGADNGVSLRDVTLLGETARSTVINLGAALGGPFDHNDLMVVFGVTGLQADDFAAS